MASARSLIVVSDQSASAEYQPRWQLDIPDDPTITFDRDTRTIAKVGTGESCDLGSYPGFTIAEPDCLLVTSGHAPPIGKWYVTGEE